MKLLITGASGQLGTELYAQSPHTTYGTYHSHAPANHTSQFYQLDITDKKAVHTLVTKLKPDWIIHLASENNVDLCEENKTHAFHINFLGVEHIVAASLETNTNLLYVSTDGVFDGTKPYSKETDATGPINYYGKTRLLAERIVSTYPNSIIARTSLLYGPTGKFATWVLKAAQQKQINAITDLYSSPTLTTELAANILIMIQKDLRGVYHTAGDERISKYDLVKHYITAFGYDPAIIKKTTMNDVAFKAPRPQDISLDITKIKKLGIHFSTIQEAMRKLKNQTKNRTPTHELL